MSLYGRFKRFVQRRMGRNQPVTLQQAQTPVPAEPDDPFQPPSGLPKLAGLSSDEDLRQHVEAYKKARYFDVTAAVNVDSILGTGLDPNFGGSATGTTAATNNQTLLPSVQGKVHIGKDRETALYYERLNRRRDPQRLRVFVSNAQDQHVLKDFQDDDNLAFHTTQHLQSNQIIQGQFYKADLASLQTLFGLVRTHYPQDPPPPDVNTIISWHFVAMKRGLLSYDLTGGGRGMRHDSF